MSYRLGERQTSSNRHGKAWAIALLIALLCSPATVVLALATEDPQSNAPNNSASVIINEVKSGGTNTTPNEYITVYNQSSQPVSLEGWTVEYAKVGFHIIYCDSSDWKTIASSSVNSASIKGSLSPGTVSTPFSLAINNDAAGAVHLVSPDHQVVDTVGWGNDTSAAPCKEQAQAPMLNSSKSLIRYLGCADAAPLDTNDNSADFMIATPTTAGVAASQASPTCAPPIAEPENNNPTASGCPGISISELLPNPAGTDTGHEFIELHNTSSQAVELSNCQLQTSANSKTYALTGITIEADHYAAISDTQSGLSLPNTSGGSVWLLDATAELQSVTYPASMEDDTVWSYVDGQWSINYTPTPDAANILQASKPCPDGQVRNTETNRCISADNAADASTVPAACAAGQERNPETNRCRAVATTSSSLAACKEGQERNPETNRCRNITTATADKACPAGQERNPDTNRCRKIAAAGSGQSGSGIDGVKDIASASIKQHKPYWLIAGGILLLAIAYAIYEWRLEIRTFCTNRLKLRMPSHTQTAR